MNIRGTILLGALLGFQIAAHSQPAPTIAPSYRAQLTIATTPLPVEAFGSDEPGENKQDPAYKPYKEGYNAILDERWQHAIERFGEVASKYPKSEYADDAAYWNAYALSHIDRKKAIEAYERFMKKFPKSRYVDDAVADLGGFEPVVVVTSTNGDSTHIVVSSSGKSYSYGVGPSVTIAESQMKKAEKMLQRQFHLQHKQNFTLDRLRIPPMASSRGYETEKLDPDTKLRIQALETISEAKDDEKAFVTLRDVALDHKQPVALRYASLDALTDFRKFDVLSIYLDLAKTDTSEKIQSAAMAFIAQGSKDKNKSVDALVDLFRSAPNTRGRQRQTALYVIAEIGNDKSIDFLTNVARTNNDYDLRSDAVYYLGTIGGEKARTALYQILRNK